MVAVLCLVTFLDSIYLTPDGPKARPESIPARWLLKYAPRELPKLPDRFFDTEWYYGFTPRSLAGAYTEWTKFHRDSPSAAGEVTVIHSGRGFNDDGRKPTLRRMPLAVYGPLVEYDGNLHTVGLTNWETDGEKKPRWALNLGAAVEVRKNVWYQAGSDRDLEGTTRAREYRLEFADDPRAKNEGQVKVFGSERLVHKYAWESFETDAEFKVNKPDSDPHRQILVTFKTKGGGTKHVYLQPGDGYYPAVISGVSRSYPSVLTAAGVPAPKVVTEPTPGLVQPPKKP